MTGPVFECRSASVALSLSSGLRPIISDINLEVRDAEFLSIVGPSGTGKTTLLRVLGGLLRPTSGEVLIKGRVMTGPPEDVVIVFQDYGNALLQWRTVRDNVAFGIERKLSRAESADRVNDALSLVGLLERAGDYPWQLSGGMQQRVQIARALALRPAVMLMDEPFAALDAMTKAGLQDELLRLRDRTRTSFVFITHDIEEAVYLGDRVAVLNGSPGRIEDVISIELPNPRDQIVTRALPEFLAYRYRLHKAIGHG
jgi:NitT/TauT family transport system ATP-binding protein